MNDPIPVNAQETFRFYCASNLGDNIDEAVIKGFLYKMGSNVTFWHFGKMMVGEVTKIWSGGALEVKFKIDNVVANCFLPFYDAFATDFQLLLELYDRFQSATHTINNLFKVFEQFIDKEAEKRNANINHLKNIY